MTLGEAIRISRKLRKLSQTELSELAGVCRSAIVSLEAGRGRMSTLMSVIPHSPVDIIGLPCAATLGDQIKVARQISGYSISQAALHCGVAPNTIRAIERGSGNVSAFVKIATALADIFHTAPVKPRKTGIWRTVAGATNRHRDPSDYYATPAPIARMLLENVCFDLTSSVLEPCVGQARVIEIVLRAAGFEDVAVSDIQATGVERRDFFDIDEQYDFIITNPPFRDHVKWIQHAKRVARQKIAMLLPLNYLTGSGRLSAVWSDLDFPLSEVLIFSRGLDFLKNPFAEKLGASQLYCAWYIWDRDHSGEPKMRWLDNDSLIARRVAS